MSTDTYRTSVAEINDRHNPIIDRLESEASALIDQYSDGGFIPNWPNAETHEQYNALDAAWKAAIEARNREIKSVSDLLSEKTADNSYNVFCIDTTGNRKYGNRLVYLHIASGITLADAIAKYDPRTNRNYSVLSDAQIKGYDRGQNGELLVDFPAQDEYSASEFSL